MDKPMTLAAKQIRGLAKVIREHGTCAPMALEYVADELDKADLAREVRVTDEEVNRVDGVNWHIPAKRAASLPVAAKVPDALKQPPIVLGDEDSGHSLYVDGWNACREAMIAQGNGGVRGLISGYLPNQRAVEIILDAPVPAWMKLGGTVSVQAPASDDAEGNGNG